jgi:diguanylate cyclase (GGDEF)-like protein
VVWAIALALLVLGAALAVWAARQGADPLKSIRVAGAASALLGAGALVGARSLLSRPGLRQAGLWLPLLAAALAVRGAWLVLGAAGTDVRARTFVDVVALASFALLFGAALAWASEPRAQDAAKAAAENAPSAGAGGSTPPATPTPTGLAGASADAKAATDNVPTAVGAPGSLGALGGPLAPRLLAGWDGLVLGLGGAALLWWAWRVPLMLSSRTSTRTVAGTGLLGLLDFAFAVGTVGLLASRLVETAQRPVAAVVAGRGAAALGALVLAGTQARWMNAGAPGAVGFLDALGFCLGPALLVGGLLGAQATASEDAAGPAASRRRDSDENEERVPNLSSWALGLACVAALAMAWRLGDESMRRAVLGARPDSLWWAPLATALAGGRLAWTRRSVGSEREVHHELRELKSVIARRTHQLATLHSMTAELSDTLSCERILGTAVERVLLALDADCAAVWLNLDASQMALDNRPAPTGLSSAGSLSGADGAYGDDTTVRSIPIAVFVWRELERTGSERRALDNLQEIDFDAAGRRMQKIGGSGAAMGGVAILDKSWSMVLARGHEEAGARNALSLLHRLLESGGIDRFSALARGDRAALDIRPADVGLSAITLNSTGAAPGAARPGAITIGTEAGGDHIRSGVSKNPKAAAAEGSLAEDLQQVLVHGHLAPIRSKGESLGALGAWRDGMPLDEAERSLVASLALEVGSVMQNVQLYQETSRLADRDSLTDLLNHRAVQSQLNAVLARSQRADTSFAVVMMDLNNFKFFNDTYGHPEGDRVLRTVARCLREACRGGDIIGRFGGDEFIALLLDTDEEGAVQACERIAARVQEEGYQQRGDARRIPITLSFGAALYPQDGTAALELLTVADTNLYEAKRNGGGSGNAINIKKQGADEEELRKLKEAGTGGSFGVLDALVTAIDNKDHYTRRHSEDVTHWASLMARQLDFSSETQRAVRIAGLLHDVGKIAVPDSILRKPGRLNDDEFQIMQQHPVFGALIVKDVPNLPEVLGGIKHHHERWDGKGYPEKLNREDIPLLGRLLAVPDCFSAMTTDRPYRKALTWVEAMDEIEKGKGTQFDPVMADAFLEVMARIVSGEDGPNGEPARARTEEAVQAQEQGVGDSAAEAVARSMAEPEVHAISPDEDDLQYRPRSVADAEK